MYSPPYVSHLMCETCFRLDERRLTTNKAFCNIISVRPNTEWNKRINTGVCVEGQKQAIEANETMIVCCCKQMTVN
jgi:hypothetical protein